MYAWLALRPDWLGLRPAWLALGPSRGVTDGRTDGWTNKQKISPFYRTLSPIGAAAPLQLNFNLKTIKRGKGTADHMMPLGGWFSLSLSLSVSVSLSMRLSLSSAGSKSYFIIKNPWNFSQSRC